MVWKKVNNSDAGTDTLHGGDSTDKISDLFSGVDVDDVDINADFTIRSAKRYLRNPANTFSYQEIGSAITANRTVTEPLLTGNDTRVYQAHTQTLTNKTISGASNTLSNIPINSLSNFAVSAPVTDQLIQYNGTNWVNATAAASVTATSTTTFTNKTIGDYLDFTRVAAPANPGTNIGRLYHKQIDANNDGMFVKLKKAGAIVEVQII